MSLPQEFDPCLLLGSALAQRQLKINGLGWPWGLEGHWIQVVCLLVFQFWVPRGLCTVWVESFVPSAPPTGLNSGLHWTAAVGSPVGQKGMGVLWLLGAAGTKPPADPERRGLWPPAFPLGKATWADVSPLRGQEGRGPEKALGPSITRGGGLRAPWDPPPPAPALP